MKLRIHRHPWADPKKFAEDMASAINTNIEDMKKEGLFTEKTTFDDVANFAGTRIRIKQDNE